MGEAKLSAELLGEETVVWMGQRSKRETISCRYNKEQNGDNSPGAISSPIYTAAERLNYVRVGG